MILSSSMTNYYSKTCFPEKSHFNGCQIWAKEWNRIKEKKYTYFDHHVAWEKKKKKLLNNINSKIKNEKAKIKLKLFTKTYTISPCWIDDYQN